MCQCLWKCLNSYYNYFSLCHGNFIIRHTFKYGKILFRNMLRYVIYILKNWKSFKNVYFLKYLKSLSLVEIMVYLVNEKQLLRKILLIIIVLMKSRKFKKCLRDFQVKRQDENYLHCVILTI